MLVLPTP
ncbi:hypothetical protein CP8484711_0750, partial [Chlamydia psittaci 84-8471/1]